MSDLFSKPPEEPTQADINHRRRLVVGEPGWDEVSAGQWKYIGTGAHLR